MNASLRLLNKQFSSSQHRVTIFVTRAPYYSADWQPASGSEAEFIKWTLGSLRFTAQLLHSSLESGISALELVKLSD
jgi:hypothetical protein